LPDSNQLTLEADVAPILVVAFPLHTLLSPSQYTYRRTTRVTILLNRTATN